MSAAFKFGGLNSLGVHTDNGQTYETGHTNSLCVLCSTIYTPSVGVIYPFMLWITGKKLENKHALPILNTV